MSSRESALPGFSMKSFIMEYSVCVSFNTRSRVSRVRLRALSRKGPLEISCSSGSSAAPRRRQSASTRAMSSAGENGFVT